MQKLDWIQRWSGSYTFISCSYWGPQYYTSLKKTLGVNFAHTLFVHKKGVVDFFVSEKELDKLGYTLAKQVIKNPKLVDKYAKLIKNSTDILIELMSDFVIPSKKQYNEFVAVFSKHLAYHGFIKETVDYLDTKSLNKYLPVFEDARKYSERIYSDSEVYFRNLVKTIAKKERRNAQLLTCLTQSELENYIDRRKLPKDALLKKRYDKSALYFSNNNVKYLFGSEVNKLEKAIIGAASTKIEEIKGVSAFKGIVRAVCRVIPNPHKYKVFNKGEILITGMTRPEFIPLIKISSAIVTDSGGVLSHAAITAREFKKPCVVGTRIATKIFKDGDLVEVDANNGIIKKYN